MAPRSMALDIARPIASLCSLAGVTLGHLARARGFAPQSLKDGPAVGFATLAAHAAALGFELRVTLVRREDAGSSS